MGRGRGVQALMNIDGEYSSQRAVQIALAGSYNLLLIGDAGSGKTLFLQEIESLGPRITPHFMNQSKLITLQGFGLLDDYHLLSHSQRMLFLSILNPASSSRWIITIRSCPCGYTFNSKRMCVCSPTRLAHHQNLLDELLSRVNMVSYLGKEQDNSHRFTGTWVISVVTTQQRLTPEAKIRLEMMDYLNTRTLVCDIKRISATIAYLGNRKRISLSDLDEAASYLPLENLPLERKSIHGD